MRVGEGARPVVLTWLLLATLSSALLLRATFASPPGTVFVGTFYYVDDFYNYLSYVQQAEGGALVFRNKLAPPTLPPALVNLEWLLVGWLAALLGGSPLIAYRLVGLAALAVLVHQVDRWLVRGGLPPPRRLPGLLLVFTGGGLGWVLVALDSRLRPYDVVAGLYPFVEVLANPHFVVGTALLAAALGAFAMDRPGLGAMLGGLLALVRPYDAALLAGVAGLAVLLRWPPRQWPRRLLPVAALVPALLYNAWVFLWSPGFRIFSAPVYAASGPSLLELTLAVGPAALIALTVARMPESGEDPDPGRRQRLYLALWAALALLMVILRPVSFSLQFLAGVGVPLLSLGAIGLSRLRRGVLEVAVPLFAGTAVLVTALQLQPNLYRNVPAERWRVAAALREVCRPGELVLAPSDIGLYVGGLSSCWPWISHTASPEHASREAATARFYSGAPPERGRLLDALCVNHVVLPRAWPAGGLPPDTPYHLGLEVDGPGGGLAVYSRDADTSCRPPASP